MSVLGFQFIYPVFSINSSEELIPLDVTGFVDVIAVPLFINHLTRYDKIFGAGRKFGGYFVLKPEV